MKRCRVGVPVIESVKTHCGHTSVYCFETERHKACVPQFVLGCHGERQHRGSFNFTLLKSRCMCMNLSWTYWRLLCTKRLLKFLLYKFNYRWTPARKEYCEYWQQQRHNTNTALEATTTWICDKQTCFEISSLLWVCWNSIPKSPLWFCVCRPQICGTNGTASPSGTYTSASLFGGRRSRRNKWTTSGSRWQLRSMSLFCLSAQGVFCCLLSILKFLFKTTMAAPLCMCYEQRPL